MFDETSESIITKTLFILRGEKWRHMRATLSPAFTGRKMRHMFELVSECADNMTNVFRDRLDHGEELNLNVKEQFGKYTMDVIASTAFGAKVNSFENENNEFLVNGQKILNTNNAKQMFKMFLSLLLPKVAKWLRIEIFEMEQVNFFKSMVVEMMDVRKKENIVRPDMINMMMQLRKGHTGVEQQPIENVAPSISENENQGFAAVDLHQEVGQAKKELTDDEIVAQCFLFFVAGFDTTSSVLSFISYELALNPDAQEKLFQECSEIKQELGGKALPYDVLQRMKYMDQVVSEGLRMWPPALNTDRMCNKDYSFDDGHSKIVIEKGTQIWIPIYGLHHDEKFYPNPERFQPERFSDENKDNIVPGSYIPFGVGPRNCIGK